MLHDRSSTSFRGFLLAYSFWYTTSRQLVKFIRAVSIIVKFDAVFMLAKRAVSLMLKGLLLVTSKLTL